MYETVKVGEADGVLGTSTDEHGNNVYTLSWEHRGITHTVMGNIPYDAVSYTHLFAALCSVISSRWASRNLLLYPALR